MTDIWTIVNRHPPQHALLLVMTHLLYESVTPATLAFSQLIAKKNNDRM